MGDLCTVSEVKEFLGMGAATDDDARLTSLVTRASVLIEKHFARKFYATGSGADANPVTEYLDGLGTESVRLNRTPITALTSVHQSTDQVWDSSTLIDPGDYISDLERGIVRLKSGIFFPGFRNVRAIYNQTTTVPDDVKQLAIEVVARSFKSRDMIHVRSIAMGEGAATERLVGHFVAEVARDFAHLYRFGGVMRA